MVIVASGLHFIHCRLFSTPLHSSMLISCVILPNYYSFHLFRMTAVIICRFSSSIICITADRLFCLFYFCFCFCLPTTFPPSLPFVLYSISPINSLNYRLIMSLPSIDMPMILCFSSIGCPQIVTNFVARQACASGISLPFLEIVIILSACLLSLHDLCVVLGLSPHKPFNGFPFSSFIIPNLTH